MKNLFFFALVGVFAVVSMVAGSGELLAQTPPVVTYTPIVDFGSIFDTITTAIGPIVVGALGLGLAIWGARYIFGIIKSMGR